MKNAFTFTVCAVHSQLIASSTGDCVTATVVGAYCVDAGLPTLAWTGMCHTLINI